MISDFMYKIVAFGDFASIEPSSANMIFMIEAFEKYGMIPSIVPQLTLAFNGNMRQSMPINRFSISSANNEENILISSDRIDFTIYAFVDEKFTDDNIVTYNSKIQESFKIIFEKFNKSSHRLAYNTNSLIKGITENQFEKFFDNFSQPIKIYKKNKLTEWGTTLITRNNTEICEKTEELNIITILTKTKLIEVSGISTDGIQVNIDINTIPEKSGLRFNANAFEEFISFSNNIKNKIIKEIEELL